MTELTDRQSEVLTLLEQGVDARSIASQLGITRNAVYLQIKALKRKGALAEDYTPSGEVRTPPTSAAHAPPAGRASASPAQWDIISQLVEQNRQLLDIVAKLTDQKR